MKMYACWSLVLNLVLITVDHVQCFPLTFVLNVIYLRILTRKVTFV